MITSNIGVSSSTSKIGTLTFGGSVCYLILKLLITLLMFIFTATLIEEGMLSFEASFLLSELLDYTARAVIIGVGRAVSTFSSVTALTFLWGVSCFDEPSSCNLATGASTGLYFIEVIIGVYFILITDKSLLLTLIFRSGIFSDDLRSSLALFLSSFKLALFRFVNDLNRRLMLNNCSQLQNILEFIVLL